MSNQTDIVHAYMDGFRRSDKPGILALLTDDVVWDLPGFRHLSGKADFEGEIVNPLFEENPTLVVDRTLEDGDTVVCIGEGSGQMKSGDEFRFAFCDVFTFRDVLIRRSSPTSCRSPDRPSRFRRGVTQVLRSRLVRFLPCCARSSASSPTTSATGWRCWSVTTASTCAIVRHSDVAPWVEDAAERDRRIGTRLDCPLCDRCEIPEGLTVMRTTATWDERSMPAALRRDHRVASGTWGRLRVEAGSLRFVARTDPITDVIVAPTPSRAFLRTSSIMSNRTAGPASRSISWVNTTGRPNDEARSSSSAQPARTLLVAATITYNVIEAIVALTAGTLASSTALIGFGLDSVIEVSSAAAVAWQFSARDPENARADHAADHRRLVLRPRRVRHRRRRSRPDGIGEAERSFLGIVLAPLARGDAVPVRRPAPAGRELGSASAVADSKQTLLCTYLSAVLLVGLVLNSLLGWSWADPIAALVIAGIAVKEGRDAWKGDYCCAIPTRSDQLTTTRSVADRPNVSGA